jgi:small subunit ribosomal protein S9
LIDDEHDKASEQEEGSVAEGSDAQPADPVAGEDSSSSRAAGEEPAATPPAGEAAEESAPEAPAAEGEAADEPEQEKADEAPAAEGEAAEGQADEAPAAEGEAAEKPVAEEPPVEAEAGEKPAAEKKPRAEAEKKDVIPGADLEPIAVEPEERPLSAEEQARLEAEEEERAKREAELVGEAEEEPSPASRAPQKMEGDARYLATGKRKTSIARVTLVPGSGKIEINKRPLEDFFPRPLHQTMARQPLTITGYEGSVDVRVRVHGGGISGQAGAVRHGIARALTEVDPELRGELKRRGFLTRDARAKERRKAGLKKARKRPQFSKR